MAHRSIRVVRWAATVALACLVTPVSAATDAGPERQGRRMAGRPEGKPAYLWVWYADGQTQPIDESYCTGLLPPEFKCSYGTDAEDCKRQVQSYLDAWYADFNLVFTLTRPPTGDYYTIVVTSNGSWCQVSSNEAGVAPFNCNDNPGLMGYAFECGRSAHDCAVVIAHEHAHMVGLEHSKSLTDIMNATVLPGIAGFDAEASPTLELQCRATQDSYTMMLTALGAWPGGDKPSPFADTPDAGVRDAATDRAGHGDASTSGIPSGPGPGGGIDAGPVNVVPGYDAMPRPPVVTVDAAVGGDGGHGGCSQLGSGTAAGSLLLALLGLLVAALIRARDHRPLGRRAPPAGGPLPCAAPVPRPSAARARAPRGPTGPRPR